MSIERQLDDVAMAKDLWSEAVQEMFEADWSIKEQADYYGQALADAVVAGAMDIADLRDLANQANDLDKEAFEKSNGDIEQLDTADYFEASARRIANKSGGVGLEV